MKPSMNQIAETLGVQLIKLSNAILYLNICDQAYLRNDPQHLHYGFKRSMIKK